MPSESRKDYYLKNRDRLKKRALDYYRDHRQERLAYEDKRRAERSALIKFAKNQPCMDCHGKFPPECMDFDHVRGTKSFGIGGNRNYSLTKLQDEIAKCDIVCANCHRIRTHSRRKHSLAPKPKK